MKIIGQIPRNVENELRVTTGKYWNKDFVDIRWYYRDERIDGKVEMLPSKKGARVNFDELPHLINLLNRAKEMQGGNTSGLENESDAPESE